MQTLVTAHYDLLILLTQVAAASMVLALIIAGFVPLEQVGAVRSTRLSYEGWATNRGWHFVDGAAVSSGLQPPRTSFPHRRATGNHHER